MLAAGFMFTVSCGGGQPAPLVVAPEIHASTAATTSAAPEQIAPAAAPGKPMLPLAPTQFTSELRELGITATTVPDWQALGPALKKKLMPLFKKSLGFEKCSGCHKSDVGIITHNMKVAKQMWQHFVVPLRQTDGSLVFCDSCHNGSMNILERSNPEALSAFMKAEYAHKVTRLDKSPHACKTCHGEPFEGDIIAKSWGIED